MPGCVDWPSRVHTGKATYQGCSPRVLSCEGIEGIEALQRNCSAEGGSTSAGASDFQPQHLRESALVWGHCPGSSL